MKKMIVVAIFLAACSVQAQGLKNATKTLTVGNWTVLRDVDAMTDKVGCTGIYKGEPSIQLSDSGFYFRVTGGIEAVTLRFDSEPARQMRLATKMEKNIRAIILDGSDFSTVTNSTRLRYQVLTLVSGTQSGDLDLSGIQEALAHIRANCPLPAKT